MVFNLLEEILTRRFGEAFWDDLLDESAIDGAYTSLGNYPHQQFVTLLAGAAGPLGLSTDDAIRWFGREAMPLLAQRFPGFFAPHREARSFVLTLNEIIHPEVRKLYPGADIPVFDFDTRSLDSLVLGYRSTRGLCLFAEGLIEGAAAHYGQSVEITQRTCTRRGDQRCEIVMRFAGGGA
jgi:hypothetical protein